MLVPNDQGKGGKICMYTRMCLFRRYLSGEISYKDDAQMKELLMKMTTGHPEFDVISEKDTIIDIHEYFK